MNKLLQFSDLIKKRIKSIGSPYMAALKMAFFYLFIGSVLVLFLDQLLELLFNSFGIEYNLVILKFFYIIITSILLFLLVSKEMIRNKHKALYKSEQALKDSLKELSDVNRALNESAIIAITDQQGRINYVNEKFCEISQYSREELIGKDHRILNSGFHSKIFFKEMWETIESGETWKGEIKNKAKDGSYYWVHTTIVPFLNEEGEPYQYVSIRNAITERKLAEEALKESEERYRRVVELSPLGIVLHVKGIIEYANPACVSLLGAASLDELLNKSVVDFAHPLSRKMVEERIVNLKGSGMVVSPTEEKVIRLDGEVIDVEVTGTTLYQNGSPAILMMFHNITRRKQAEEALRQNEEKYRLIADNMTDLVRVVDVNGFITYASPSHKYVLGFPPTVFEGNLAFDMVHPDDRPYMESIFTNAIEAKENYVTEFRYKHAKGYWVWMEAKGTPILDKGEKPLFLQVVARDITERKMFEEKLRFMAFHDILTDIPNRRLLQERLEQTLKMAERYRRKFAVMYLDLDNFKQINDTLGHAVGDELLKQFSERVQGCLRESDTLARQGGDEFTILLSEIKEENDAFIIAERILKSIQESWIIGEHEFHTTSSIGIAFYPIDGTTSSELMNHADAALYQAKGSGRNNIKVYTPLKNK